MNEVEVQVRSDKEVAQEIAEVLIGLTNDERIADGELRLRLSAYGICLLNLAGRIPEAQSMDTMREIQESLQG